MQEPTNMMETLKLQRVSVYHGKLELCFYSPTKGRVQMIKPILTHAEEGLIELIGHSLIS